VINILGRVAFNSESSIIVPLRIDNKIIGVVRFCSTREQDNDFKFKYYISIVELIAEKISELVRQERTLEELNKEKLLLKMGAEVFEMASYSRELYTNVVYVTPAFNHIFDLEPNENLDTLHIKELISQEPLRTINGYSNIISKNCANTLNDCEKEYFSYITDASNRMREQIDGLLKHSRIGQKKQMELVDMNDLLKNVISDLKSSIDSSKAVLLIRDLPDIFGYATELRLLLINLIGNAIKFMQPDICPIIEIGSCEDKEHYYTFYVKDNGIGISEENIKKIFNLFTRLNKRSEFEGTGIGLTHCKKIVQLHNGEISVQSELGKGSTFSFAIKK